MTINHKHYKFVQLLLEDEEDEDEDDEIPLILLLAIVGDSDSRQPCNVRDRLEWDSQCRKVH